jgi:hypothetical protein
MAQNRNAYHFTWRLSRDLCVSFRSFVFQGARRPARPSLSRRRHRTARRLSFRPPGKKIRKVFSKEQKTPRAGRAPLSGSEDEPDVVIIVLASCCVL